MKIAFACVVLGAAAIAADGPSISGNWQVAISVGGNDRDQSCTFTQKERELTGTCKTDRGDVKISGTVEDKKVSWTYKSEYSGMPLTVSFKGARDSDETIKGAVIVEEMGFEGEFTATRSK